MANGYIRRMRLKQDEKITTDAITKDSVIIIPTKGDFRKENFTVSILEKNNLKEEATRRIATLCQCARDANGGFLKVGGMQRFTMP